MHGYLLSVDLWLPLKIYLKSSWWCTRASNAECQHITNFFSNLMSVNLWLPLKRGQLYKTVQPNLCGSDFAGRSDTICIWVFQSIVSFLAIGRQRWEYYRWKAELSRIRAICNTWHMSKIIHFVHNAKNWIYNKKDFGGKIRSAQIRFYSLIWNPVTSSNETKLVRCFVWQNGLGVCSNADVTIR